LAWLKKREEANQLRVTALSDKHYRNILEDCLGSARPAAARVRMRVARVRWRADARCCAVQTASR
jgi:hypothetical protein